VRVFGDCAGIDGTFEGVEWLDYRRYRNLSCDVLLTSKQPAAVDAVHNVTAKVRVLWIHDVHYGEKLSPERDARLDAYLCLSAWHVAYFRQHYQRINPNKVFQARNGLASSAFARRDDEPRDPHRVIFSSSPDRGLQLVLDVWPEIRAQVPDATLHVYYGFDNWERMAKLTQDQRALAVIASLKQQIASVEGVVFHGRANPEALARAFRLSGVWAYPTWFTETSCITAMQAQAAGLGIVTSALAALNETVGDRGVLLTEDPESEAYRVAFTKATIGALQAVADERRRAEIEQYAEYHFDLTSLAEDFERFFRRLLSGGVAAFESNMLAG